MNLEYLFFTHCHHDHYLGLPHLLFYLSMRRREYPNHPLLKIVGPAEDTEKVVALAHCFLQIDRFPELEQRPEIIPLNPGESYQTDVFCIDTCATIHPVQGLCYKFIDKKSRAVFAFTGDTAYHSPRISKGFCFSSTKPHTARRIPRRRLHHGIPARRKPQQLPRRLATIYWRSSIARRNMRKQHWQPRSGFLPTQFSQRTAKPLH